MDYEIFDGEEEFDIVFDLGFGRNVDRSGDSVCSNDGGLGVDLFHSLTSLDPPICSPPQWFCFSSVSVLNSFEFSFSFFTCDVRFVEKSKES